MEKRTAIAIALSLVVWLVWSYFFIKPKMVEQNAGVVTTKEEKEKPVSKQVTQTDTRPAYVSTSKKIKEEFISLSTGKYAIEFTTRGAAIKDYKYKDRNIDLVVGANKFNAKGKFDFSLYLNEGDFINGSQLENEIWNFTKPSDKEIVFQTTLLVNGSPLQINKIYTLIDDNSCFRVSFKIKNLGNKDIVIPGSSIIISPTDFLGPAMDFESSYNQINSMFYVNNEFHKGEKGGGIFSKEEVIQYKKGETRWVGVMSRYFLLIMMPEKFVGQGALYDGRKATGFRTGMNIHMDVLKPAKEVSMSFKVYAGEKDKDKLKAIDEVLVDAVDVSKWIEPIRDLLLWSLLKINILFHNFGWSLIVFSIITKIILMPLTIKSTESMKKLQALNPQINEMRAKYKDKPEILNKKIMELYKKNKVNPASGCLPLLLQMPFFFALYSALINSIDLWQAPFIFWIKDLSMPDTIMTISGFNINILPIIMTGTTFLQQKMTTGDAMGQQQKMMMFMPLIFIVIFWNMPSGLVLYWSMQNILQILQQLYINKKGKKEAVQE